MPLSQGTHFFMLTSAVPYSRDGGTQNAQYVELREPDHSHFTEYMHLKQSVTALQLAVGEQARKQGDAEDMNAAAQEAKGLQDQSDEGHEQAAKEVGAALAMAFGIAPHVDMADFVAAFGKMAARGSRGSVAALDGVQPMTDSIWQRVSLEDKLTMATEYAAFFCTLLPAIKAAESDKTSESHTRVTVD